MQTVKHLLDYAATNPNAILTYQSSDMVVAGHSDASYLLETKSRSIAGENIFMSNNTAFPPNNVAVLTIAKIIKAVISSTAETQLGAIFINCKEAITELQALEVMELTQTLTPMQTDNTIAHGVVTNNISRKQLKSMGMKLHWLRCRKPQGNFRNYWRSGPTNLGYYVTKHHAAIHYRTISPHYLTPKRQLDLLRNRVTSRGSLPEE